MRAVDWVEMATIHRQFKKIPMKIVRVSSCMSLANNLSFRTVNRRTSENHYYQKNHFSCSIYPHLPVQHSHHSAFHEYLFKGCEPITCDCKQQYGDYKRQTPSD